MSFNRKWPLECEFHKWQYRIVFIYIMEILIYILAPLVVANLVVAVFSLIRMRKPDSDKAEEALREEFRVSREENAQQSIQLREEVRSMQNQSNDSLIKTVNTMGSEQEKRLDKLTDVIGKSGETIREGIENFIKQAEGSLKEIRASNEERFEKIRASVNEQIQEMMAKEEKKLGEVVSSLDKLSRSNRDDLEKARKTMEENRKTLETQFQRIQESNEKKLDEMRESNEKELNKMRETVDEKLQSTLEKRLGESFKLVSDRLEAVHKGLGEMQELATGVGDLKRVLTNVRERGTLGEYLLGDILADILTPDQYERNVRPTSTREVVEFAVRLPGKDGNEGHPVWLPIDSKFPKENYERLLDAVKQSDPNAAQLAEKALADDVRKAAKDISGKYVSPPQTTDFAIMFLPTEGLYAEVLRQPGLHDQLQSQYRVLVTGPTTLAALLNSLRIGFRTLAIEKRSSEVWQVLGAVKTEFFKFGEALKKVKKQLNSAAKTIDDDLGTRTRVMTRKLREVEKLPQQETDNLLGLTNGGREAAEDGNSENEGDEE